MYSRVMVLRKKIRLEKFRYKVQLISVLQLLLGVVTILFITVRNSFFLYVACGATSGITVFLMFLSSMNAVWTVMCWGINVYVIDRIHKNLEQSEKRIFGIYKPIPYKTEEQLPWPTPALHNHSSQITLAAATLMCFSRLISLSHLFMYKTHIAKSSICGIVINPSLLLEILSCCLYVVSVLVASAVYFCGRRFRKESSSFFSANPVDLQLRRFTLLLLGMLVLSAELLIRITDVFGVSSASFPVANTLAMLGLFLFAAGNFYGLCCTGKKLASLEYEVETEARTADFYVEPIAKLISYNIR
ncbi:hypothetical protein [Anaplasma bovis]|uniref:hypothetical protein n=1 Tax=Anaplasma bovis TaxID=186733 RepID=UPI002FF14CDC